MKPQGSYSPFAFVFGLGQLTLASQVVLARELLASFGGTEILLSSYYCVWLASLGTGALLARKRLQTTNWLPILSLLFAALPPWMIFLLRLSPTILGVTSGGIGPWWGAQAMILLALAPLGLVAGALFPLAASLFPVAKESSSRIGYLYMAESGGSLVTGVVASFWLLDRVDSFSVLLPFTAVFAAGFVLLVRSLGVGNQLRFRLGLVIVLIHALAWSGAGPMTEIHRWERVSGGSDLVWTQDSKYAHLQVGRIGDRSSFYANGELLFSCPPDPLELIEARVMLLLPRNMKTVVVAGHPTPPIATILPDSADLMLLQEDPLLANTALAFCLDNAINPVISDLRAWLGENRHDIDLLVVHAPEPVTASVNRYYTQEFFRLAAENLSPQGVFAIPAHLPAALLSGDRFVVAGGIHRDLNSVFGSVIASPGPGGWFFASPDSSFTFESIRERASRTDIGDDLSSVHIEILFPEIQSSEVLLALSESKMIPPNTDRHPSAYAYQLRVWLKRSGLRDVPYLLFSPKTLRLFSTLLAAIVLLWAIKRRKSKKNLCGGVIMSTGFVSFSASLLLILGFQHVAGTLYNRLAALSGLYMAGLSIGAFLGTRKPRALVFTDGLLVILLLLCSIAVPVIRWSILYYALCFALATIAGMQFPAAVSGMIVEKNAPRYTAGYLDALDHLGASVGAVMAGLVLLPTLGFGGTFVLLALLKSFSALSGLLSARPSRSQIP